jgi:5'(3')-deoxyribonucleotidase
MTPGFYRSLPVTPGAKEAVQEMLEWRHVHLFVASKIPDKNALAATEKLQWLHEDFPGLEERIILTPNKACIGTARDFLVDDRKHKADAGFFPGTFLHFGSPGLLGWPEVMSELRAALA